MFYNSQDKHGFLQGELAGLRNACDAAGTIATQSKAGWSRAETDTLMLSDADEKTVLAAETRERAKRESFRMAHIQATNLRDEVAGLEFDCGIDGWEDSDLDEYGYAA